MNNLGINGSKNKIEMRHLRCRVYSSHFFAEIIVLFQKMKTFLLTVLKFLKDGTQIKANKDIHLQGQSDLEMQSPWRNIALDQGLNLGKLVEAGRASGFLQKQTPVLWKKMHLSWSSDSYKWFFINNV